MRLIDADVLKEQFSEIVGEYIVTDIRKIIDNTPTIPLPDFKEGYKQAIIDGKTNFSRPQGEWGKHGECPFCSYIRQWEDDKFCGNCGADMRGGAE